MPKRPPYVAGEYYHFYNRGRSRLSIFHDQRDYLDVLDKMKRYSRKYSIAVIAYCLLPNHYHFLARQDGTPRAGLLPQYTFNQYSKTYNKKYKHSGTIFEGPYRVRPVKDEHYLLHLCRYIHANPVSHGIVREIADWPYSNYHEWMGVRPGTLVDRAFVEAHFPDPAAYQSFTLDYLRHRRHPAGHDYLDDW